MVVDKFFQRKANPLWYKRGEPTVEEVTLIPINAFHSRRHSRRSGMTVVVRLFLTVRNAFLTIGNANIIYDQIQSDLFHSKLFAGPAGPEGDHSGD